MQSKANPPPFGGRGLRKMKDFVKKLLIEDGDGFICQFLSDALVGIRKY